MKKLAALFLTALLGACSNGDSAAPEGLNLENYQGRWLVINYWAEWCKPCIEEIPELNVLDATYPQVAVLGVNFDGATGVPLAQQVKKLGIEFPILALDPADTLQVERPVVLPATFILNPDGKLVHSLVGPQTLESLAMATGQVGIPVGEPEAEVENTLPR